MHFRGASDVNSPASCSYSGSGSAHTQYPHFHLSRLSRAVGSARALRAAPLLTLGGALGALAISRLRAQVRTCLPLCQGRTPGLDCFSYLGRCLWLANHDTEADLSCAYQARPAADVRPRPGPCRASAMHGNAAPESTAESTAERVESDGGSSAAAAPGPSAREPAASDSTQSRACVPVSHHHHRENVRRPGHAAGRHMHASESCCILVPRGQLWLRHCADCMHACSACFTSIHWGPLESPPRRGFAAAAGPHLQQWRGLTCSSGGTCPTMVPWWCRASNGAAFAPTIRLELAAALIPHPDKADRGGEDAVFLGDDRRSFGARTLQTLQLR